MKTLEKKEGSKKKFKFDKNLVIGLVVGFILGALLFSGGNSDKIAEYESQISTYKSQISDDKKEIETLQAKVDEAQPWFEMKEEERKAEAEKLEAEKKAKEEKEKREQEEKEKRGYDTGITYKQLARNPEKYEGQKVKFTGEVIQVMEGDDEVQIRLAVGGDYDNVIYGSYDKSIVSSRVLEDDYITIRGVSQGLLTYESTMGASITIPSVSIDKINY